MLRDLRSSAIAVVVLTLALGIAVNTQIFGLVSAQFLQPLKQRHILEGKIDLHRIENLKRHDLVLLVSQMPQALADAFKIVDIIATVTALLALAAVVVIRSVT